MVSFDLSDEGEEENMSSIAHAAERKAFEVALNSVMKKSKNAREEGFVGVVNVFQKILGNTWPPEAFDRLRIALGKDGKWTEFFCNLLDTRDTEFLKGIFMSFGYEGALSGYRQSKKMGEKLGTHLPWVILFDPTSACNLHCTGCWASEYKHTLNLSYEDMDSIVTQGTELGIHEYVMTGGEPMVRKDDIIRLAGKHSDCGFMIFTNGTLVDQKFCDDVRRCKNIILVMSIEGFEETTDARRGKGTFKKVMDAMDLMNQNGLVYGTSICYTSKNVKAVTSDEFLDFLISKGVQFSWYFHYMPVGNDADVELMPTPEQREYMFHRVREVRGYEGGKPIWLMDFQNDGDKVHGCIAGGRCYCHINPNGDVEPCVFIHYSSANIHEKSLLECLQQPIFKAYQDAQPFNDNYLRPCPMLENPEYLRKLVEETGARSTDMLSPESAEHLCEKCDAYAKAWKPTADRLWAEEHPAQNTAKESISKE